MDIKENEVICKCKNVTVADIEKALYDHKHIGDVEKEFDDVQKVTNCSTGCGGCHQKVLDVISHFISG